MSSPPASSGPRRCRRTLRAAALALLVLCVLLAHLWLAGRLVPEGLGGGDAGARIARIDVAFVRVLRPAPPPAVLRAPRALRRALRRAAPLAPVAAEAADVADVAQAAEAAASAPLLEALAAPLPQIAPAPPPPAASAATLAAHLPSSAEATPAPPAEAAGFEWPPSTRLSYLLTGNYRGPVEGQARVEWLMSGAHYQVHLELSIGPPFAPLASRRLASDGEVTAQGLAPRRYEEQTRIALQSPRVVTLALEPDRVVLADGRVVPRPAGVQDSASQFVQMTWLFTTRAGLLASGQKVELALALPRAVEPWIYDVLDEETVYTAAGPVQAMHVKPRREARPGGALTAEFWVAPTLQYLPVRIVIRQDARTWVDLMLERLPQQALREPAR